MNKKTNKKTFRYKLFQKLSCYKEERFLGKPMSGNFFIKHQVDTVSVNLLERNSSWNLANLSNHKAWFHKDRLGFKIFLLNVNIICKAHLRI